MIKKTLTVKQVANYQHKRSVHKYAYKVVQVTNSIAPSINDFIEAHDLQELYCDHEEWTVTIKAK